MAQETLAAIQAAIDETLSEARAQELLDQFVPYIGLQPPQEVLKLLGGIDNFLVVETKAKELITKIHTEFPGMECQCGVPHEYEARED